MAQIDSLKEYYEFYEQRGSLTPFAVVLESYARSSIDSVPLAGKLQDAERMLRTCELLYSRANEDPTFQEASLTVHRAFYGQFTPVAHDLLLMSAFELFAKAALLRKGCVVHKIVRPKELAKRQQSKPIHRNIVRATAVNGLPVQFSQNTIGLSELLKPAYLAHYPMSATERAGLRESHDRRNTLHFRIVTVWRVDADLLAFMQYLQRVVPRFRDGRLPKRRKP